MKNKIIGGIALLAAVGIIVFFAVNNKEAENETLNAENTEMTTTGETVEITTSENAEDLLIGLSDVELSDDIKTKVEEIGIKINEYYVKNKTKKQLISSYGMLYNNESSIYVEAADLRNEGIFGGEDDIVNNIDILLMAPNDVAVYSANVDKKSDELEIFTVFNSEEGYFVANDNYESFMLNESDYSQLVMSYSFIHGEVRNPVKGDDDYTAIMEAVNFSGNYDVKHIACDDKYAVVVVGSLDDTLIVKEYVLCKNDDGWEKGISDLETESNVYVAVNSVYPKMEIGLLPKYIIADYGQLKNGFSTYLDALVQLEMITEDDLPATYTCGVGRFAYIECNDKKLLGWLNDEGKLEFYQVADVTEAVSDMLQFDSTPPVFILNFGN